MSGFDELNDANFMLYAMRCYEKPNCIMAEFEDDLKRIKYVKRLLKRWRSKKVLKERLILNHIVIMSNVFGPNATARILFYKIEEADHRALKTFLAFLRIMPEKITGLQGKTIRSSELPIDAGITEILRQI